MSKIVLFFQLFRFGLVGVIAAMIHLAIVVLLVQMYSLLPLLANMFGFAIAFQVSYWGHRLWTFQESVAPHRIAAPKLLLVQILSFAANETLFYILLALHLPYPIALIIVLAVLPIFTFMASKLWVFA
jgi:putative flippase GtrA